MPRRDGTGPTGAGPGTGAGTGRRGGGGKMGGPKAAGPDGYCVCPVCGERVPHVVGQPCSSRPCPKCGARMARE